MNTPRWSVRNALRAARAARTAIARAAIRHRRDALVGRQLGRALRASWVLIDELERALARARHVKRKAAA